MHATEDWLRPVALSLRADRGNRDGSDVSSADTIRLAANWYRLARAPRHGPFMPGQRGPKSSGDALTFLVLTDSPAPRR